MSINWIEHAGRKILYFDYRNCMTQEDMIDQLDRGDRNRPRFVGSPACADEPRGLWHRPGFHEQGQTHARDVYVKKDARHAIVGIVGFTRMLLHGYIAFSGSQHTRLLATEDEAKKWLTS